MGGHVPAVGHESHGTVNSTCRDLDHHHGGGQCNDEPCPSFVAFVAFAKKNVLMLAIHLGYTNHEKSPSCVSLLLEIGVHGIDQFPCPLRPCPVGIDRGVDHVHKDTILHELDLQNAH